MRAKGIDANLADPASGHAINDYLYLIGDDLAGLKTSGPATMTVKENGPLVASLLVESDAPGCYKLRREVRLTAGLTSGDQQPSRQAAAWRSATTQEKARKHQLRLSSTCPRPALGWTSRSGWFVPIRTTPRLQELVHRETLGRRVEPAGRRDVGHAEDTPLVELGAVTAALLELADRYRPHLADSRSSPSPSSTPGP